MKDDRLLRDIADAPGDTGAFHLWWLGQSGFLLKWGDRHAIFDPYLSESLTLKYAGTDKPHVRMTERCVAPERLGFVDVAFSSHEHSDHFDPATLAPIARAARDQGRRLQLVLPRAVLASASPRLGDAEVQFTPIDAGETTDVLGFGVTAVPSAHPALERDERGRCLFLGFIVRFGPWTVYHSGDTLTHPGLAPLLMAARPDLVLLPINGNRPERRVAGNMNGAEAAGLAKACGASLAIPHHYDMFAINTDPPDEVAAACVRLGQPYRILRCAERWSSGELSRVVR